MIGHLQAIELHLQVIWVTFALFHTILVTSMLPVALLGVHEDLKIAVVPLVKAILTYDFLALKLVMAVDCIL